MFLNEKTDCEAIVEDEEEDEEERGGRRRERSPYQKPTKVSFPKFFTS